MTGIKYKAAAVLAYPELNDGPKTIQKAADMAADAARQGAKLVVFPETFIPQYPWWVWLALGTPKRTELYKALYENSVEVPGPGLDPLCRIAEQLNIFIVVGVSERDGGTMYNSQVFIDDQGKIIGKRRKLMPTGQERTVWGRGYGDGVKVLDTAIGKLGGLICYEHTMPLARFSLLAQGEQVHVANWPGANFSHQPRDRSACIDAAMRNLGFEGQVFIVFSSSGTGPEEVALYHEADPTTQAGLKVGGGIAGIVNPYGSYIAGPIEHEEGFVIGEIDLDLIVEAKMIIDSVGHYARNDVFTLLLDDEPKPGFISATSADRRTELLAGWESLKSGLASGADEETKAKLAEFEDRLRDLLD